MFLHRKRRDANHADLKALAERIGASWLDLADHGDGCPDASVGWQGTDAMIEIKSPGGNVKPGQIDFAKRWRGRPVTLIRTGNDLLGLLLGPSYGTPTALADAVIPPARVRKRRT